MSYIDPNISLNNPIAWVTSNLQAGSRSGQNDGHVYLFLEYSEWVETESAFWRFFGYSNIIQKHVIERIDFVPDRINYVRYDGDRSGLETAIVPESGVTPFSGLSHKTRQKRRFDITVDQIRKIDGFVRWAMKNRPKYQRRNPDPERNIHSCASAIATLCKKVEIGGPNGIGTLLTQFGIYTPANLTMDWSAYISGFFGTPEGRECCSFIGKSCKYLVGVTTGITALVAMVFTLEQKNLQP